MPKRDDNPSDEKQQEKRRRVTLSLGNKNGTGGPQPIVTQAVEPMTQKKQSCSHSGVDEQDTATSSQTEGSSTEQQQPESSRSTTAIESNCSTDAAHSVLSPIVESTAQKLPSCSINSSDIHNTCPSSQKEGSSTESQQTESGRSTTATESDFSTRSDSTSLAAKGNVKEVVQGPSRTLEKGKAKQIRNVTINQKEDVATSKISVQSIITIPTRRLVDEDQFTCYNKVLQQRIKTLSTYVNKDATVYALGKLLPTATWGIFQPQADRRNELCDPATNDPIIIWTVGHVASSWFTKNGEPERQASLTVVPVSHSLAEQYTLLLAALSTPPLKYTGDSLNGVRAIKWQSEKGSSEPILFDEVYDARDVFTNKKDMPQIAATELQKTTWYYLKGRLLGTEHKMKARNGHYYVPRWNF